MLIIHSIIILLNVLSEPLSPNFSIIGEYHHQTETTVTLNWEKSQLSAGVMNIYNTIIYFSTGPVDPDMNFNVTPPWNVTVAHNTHYTVNAVARNCAGESQPSTLPLNYSKKNISFHYS